MADVVYVAIILGFFTLAWGLVRLCDRIIGPDEISETVIETSDVEVAA